MNMRWEWLTFCFDFYLNGALCVSACVCCVICFYFDLLFFESMVLWLAWKFKIVLVFRQSIVERAKERAHEKHIESLRVFICVLHWHCFCDCVEKECDFWLCGACCWLCEFFCWVSSQPAICSVFFWLLFYKFSNRQASNNSALKKNKIITKLKDLVIQKDKNYLPQEVQLQ